MKKGKITLGIVLGLLIIGFVVAQAQGAFDAGSDSAVIEPFSAEAAGGVFCLGTVGHCNDVKFAYQYVGDSIFSLNGYEYGCGADERLVYGTMRVEDGTLYIGYTIITSSSYSTPRIGQHNAQIDLATLSGPYQYAYHYDGYHEGTGTAVLIACPAASAVQSGGVDVGQ
jgi:hypothetical protein